MTDVNGRPVGDGGVLSRRHLLRWIAGGAGAVALAGGASYELIEHRVLPGKGLLDRLDGACSVGPTPFAFGPLGVNETGTFYSRWRQRTVTYSIGYPVGHQRGEPLPLIVMLHGHGGNHATALTGMTPAQAVALKVEGRALTPMALVTVDGGLGYWNTHPHDDPSAMVMDELLPLCLAKGLGATTKKVGLMGISMGGFGALSFAERHPGRFAAVAAISPAIWQSYDEAHTANADAFASAARFAQFNVITHASMLEATPVRMTSAYDDPFYANVEVMAAALPSGAEVVLGPGCHTDAFFREQEPPSLSFLSRHLA